MYHIIANKNIKKWLAVNLSKYATSNSNKYLHDYYYSRIKHKQFKISIYTTNLLTIDADPNYGDKIYKSLITNCGETNFQGMDEVGVGDFFGPVVYVCVMLDQKSIDFLANNPVKINDSKKLSDLEVIETFNTLKNDISYNVQIVFDKDVDNLNSIEQKMVYHNRNLFDSSNTVLDLFTTENAFNKYTKSHNLLWPENIILETKADSKYICVALASIFARAIFLQEIDKLEEKYDYTFPLGANNVIDCGVDFAKQYSLKELSQFCKTTFKTYQQIENKIK